MKTHPVPGPGPPAAQDHLTGGGEVCLTQGHTCRHHATLAYSSLEMFVLFVVRIPAREECTLRARGSVKGAKSVDPAWGQLASEGQARSDDGGGVVILPPPSIQEKAAQVAWPSPSQVPRSPKGRDQRVGVG